MKGLAEWLKRLKAVDDEGALHAGAGAGAGAGASAGAGAGAGAGVVGSVSERQGTHASTDTGMR